MIEFASRIQCFPKEAQEGSCWPCPQGTEGRVHEVVPAKSKSLYLISINVLRTVYLISTLLILKFSVNICLGREY